MHSKLHFYIYDAKLFTSMIFTFPVCLFFQIIILSIVTHSEMSPFKFSI